MAIGAGNPPPRNCTESIQLEVAQRIALKYPENPPLWRIGKRAALAALKKQTMYNIVQACGRDLAACTPDTVGRAVAAAVATFLPGDKLDKITYRHTLGSLFSTAVWLGSMWGVQKAFSENNSVILLAFLTGLGIVAFQAFNNGVAYRAVAAANKLIQGDGTGPVMAKSNRGFLGYLFGQTQNALNENESEGRDTLAQLDALIYKRLKDSRIPWREGTVRSKAAAVSLAANAVEIYLKIYPDVPVDETDVGDAYQALLYFADAEFKAAVRAKVNIPNLMQETIDRLLEQWMPLGKIELVELAQEVLGLGNVEALPVPELRKGGYPVIVEPTPEGVSSGI
jgi:hypothetical protein